MPAEGRSSKARIVTAAAAALCVLAGLPAIAAPSAAPPAAQVSLEGASVPASADARQVAHWIVDSGDNRGRPFAIVDKRAAQLVVFEPGGRIVGAASALLGSAIGDDAMPGLGALDPADIAPADRTTPAGRFASEPGRNLDGEAVIWFDYDAGLAIHRVRPGNAQQPREQRLSSASTEDNRVSLGCVIVAPAFFDAVVQPLLGRGDGVVYVLSEMRPVHEAFGGEWMALRRP